MNIILHLNHDRLSAQVVNDHNELISVIESHDIVGLPKEIMSHPKRLQHYLACTWPSLTQYDDGSYKLTIRPRLLGGGKWDFLTSICIVMGGVAVTVLTAGLGSVAGAALVGAGAKGAVHAWRNKKNFEGDYFKQIAIGGLTGGVTGGFALAGAALAGSGAVVEGSALTWRAIATASSVNAVGGVASRTIEAVCEDEEMTFSEVASSAIIGGLAGGISLSGAQNFQTLGNEAAATSATANEAIKDASIAMKEAALLKLSWSASVTAKEAAVTTMQSSLKVAGTATKAAIEATAKATGHVMLVSGQAAVAGAAVQTTTTVINNKLAKQSWKEGLGKAAVKGAKLGMVTSVAGCSSSATTLIDNAIPVICTVSVPTAVYARNELKAAQRSLNEEQERVRREMEVNAGLSEQMRQNQNRMRDLERENQQQEEDIANLKNTNRKMEEEQNEHLRRRKTTKTPKNTNDSSFFSQNTDTNKSAKNKNKRPQKVNLTFS